VFVGGLALKQLWVFLLIPTLGGAVGGALFRLRALAVDQDADALPSRSASKAARVTV
jgi:hypothetical protein